jgi:hypothetical protein
MPLPVNDPLYRGLDEINFVQKFALMNIRYNSKTVLLFVTILLFSNLLAGEDTPAVIKTEICIVGAGSSGIGAALAASRAGGEVVLIEKADKVGGTSTLSYVNSWEPGTGCDYAYEIYRRMSQKANSTGVARQIHSYQSAEPYGISLIDTGLSYYRSLRRSDLDVKTQCANIVFDVDEFDRTVRKMLEETGKCKLFLNTKFIKAEVHDKQVKRIETISNTGEKYWIQAEVFIDCTGDAFLCRDAGCETMLGEDPQSLFGEPSAPENGSRSLNAISLCYQIKPSENQGTTTSHVLNNFNYNVAAHVTGPVGEKKKLTVNPLGIVPGELLLRQSRDSVYSLAREQVDRHWAKLRTYPHFREYEFDSYAPNLGIRESYRVVCEYVLTQNDLLQGLSQQKHDDIITVADHPMDIHGANSSLKTLKEAYGVPYRCLIPQGWTNLLVAGKCAGFSHIAASSCRLSRTMMSLGHAAGFAASIAAREDLPVYAVPAERIQAEMNLKLRPKEKLDAEPLPISKTIGKANYGFYCCDNGNDSIYQVSKTGEIMWSYPAPDCQDIQVLPNGNILFTYHHGEKGRGGVTELTQEKKVVFNYETKGEVHTCQRLDNGNTLVGINENASLIEVNKQGDIEKTIFLQTGRKGHDAIRMARKLPNGNYLVCQEGDQLVAEYNGKGKLLKSFSSPGKCFEAIRLENGNTLICDGSACSVREVDKKGKVVWQITKDDFPEIKMNWLAGIKILSNGNIVICNWLGHGKAGEGIPVFEVSKHKEIVFYFTDHVRTQSISNIYPVTD